LFSLLPTFWRLAFVADFEIGILTLKHNLIWKTKLQLTTKTAMTLTACYLPLLLEQVAPQTQGV